MSTSVWNWMSKNSSSTQTEYKITWKFKYYLNMVHITNHHKMWCMCAFQYGIFNIVLLCDTCNMKLNLWIFNLISKLIDIAILWIMIDTSIFKLVINYYRLIQNCLNRINLYDIQIKDECHENVVGNSYLFCNVILVTFKI